MSIRVRQAIVAAVAVIASIGIATPAAAAPDRTPPTTPSNLSVQNLAFTSATLTWSPSTDNSGWLMYVAELTAPGFSQRWGALTPTKSFTGLPQGVTFTASVHAIDGAQNTSAKVSIQFTTPVDTQAPQAPGNLRAVTQGGVFTAIAWDHAVDNSTALTYRLYSGPTEIDTSGLITGTQSGLSLSVEELVFVYCVVDAGSTHTLTVKATDQAGNVSPASTPLTVTFPTTQ